MKDLDQNIVMNALEHLEKSGKEQIDPKLIEPYENLLNICSNIVWPLPPIDFMPYNIFEHLKDSSKEEVEKTLIAHFTNDGKIGSMLSLHLCDKKRMKNWTAMFEGASVSFSNQHYTSSACALFPIIEGMLTSFIEDGELNKEAKFKTEAKSKQLVNHLEEKKHKYLYEYLSFISIKKCLDVLFAGNLNSKINQPFNRNLLLHGNLHREIKKEECLKLYAIIDTLLRLKGFFFKGELSWILFKSSDRKALFSPAEYDCIEISDLSRNLLKDESFNV